MLSKFICTSLNCGRTFDSKKGLIYHERGDARHNPNETFNKFNKVSGNKRHLIPYESSKDIERKNAQKRIAEGPHFIDVDILICVEQIPM